MVNVHLVGLGILVGLDVWQCICSLLLGLDKKSSEYDRIKGMGLGIMISGEEHYTLRDSGRRVCICMG